MIRAIRATWRAKWNILRWAIAGFLLWTALADTGARLARLQLAALPEYDAAPEIAALRAEKRYGEALVLADGAIERAQLNHASPEKLARLTHERELTIIEQHSFLRRAEDLGWGAITGGAGIDPGRMSIEMLIGAIATDMLVIGDVRDLLIQGYDFAVDGRADPVIVALSAVGIATTLAPEIDWAPSILKIARKAGTMSEKMAAFVVRCSKGGKLAELKPLLADAAAIAKRSSPGSTVRLLRLAEGPEDVARIARFVEREGKAGAAALHASGQAGAAALKAADELRLAGRVEEAARVERLVMKAADKGPAGAAWLRRTGAALARPHPLIGLLKGVYKGHAVALVQKALESLDAVAWWVIPLLAGWFVVESGLLLRRLNPSWSPGRRLGLTAAEAPYTESLRPN
jgi:hypothetical protein